MKCKNFCKNNAFPFEMVAKYLKVSTKYELIYDFLLSLIFSIGVVYFYFSFEIEKHIAITDIGNVTDVVITAVSILIGFNITSMSMFLTSSTKKIEDLKKEGSKELKGENVFTIMIIYIIAPIIIQLFIVAIGVLYKIVLTHYFNGAPLCVLKGYMIVFLWLVFISFNLTIRNIKNLYHVVK